MEEARLGQPHPRGPLLELKCFMSPHRVGQGRGRNPHQPAGPHPRTLAPSSPELTLRPLWPKEGRSGGSCPRAQQSGSWACGQCLQSPHIWGLRRGRCLGPDCHPHFTDRGTFLTPQGLELDRLVVSWLGCSTPWSLGQGRDSLLV